MRVVCQGRMYYLFVMKSRTVRTKAKREIEQPVRVMNVRICWSSGLILADTCGESTEIQKMLSLYFICLYLKLQMLRY